MIRVTPDQVNSTIRRYPRSMSDAFPDVRADASAGRIHEDHSHHRHAWPMTVLMGVLAVCVLALATLWAA